MHGASVPRIDAQLRAESRCHRRGRPGGYGLAASVRPKSPAPIRAVNVRREAHPEVECVPVVLPVRRTLVPAYAALSDGKPTPRGFSDAYAVDGRRRTVAD